jgi:hypothetical protein
VSGLGRSGIAVAGAALAAVTAVVLATGGLTGVDRLWPVLIGAAVGLAPGPVPGRLGALVLGIAAGWLGVVLRIGVLPDTATGRGLAGLVVLLALVAVAVASRDRIPLWAALVGAAGYLALADAVLAVDATAFAADRLGALGTLLLGAGLGAAAAVLARAGVATAQRRPSEPAAEDAASADEPASEVRP